MQELRLLLPSKPCSHSGRGSRKVEQFAKKRVRQTTRPAKRNQATKPYEIERHLRKVLKPKPRCLYLLIPIIKQPE